LLLNVKVWIISLGYGGKRAAARMEMHAKPRFIVNSSPFSPPLTGNLETRMTLVPLSRFSIAPTFFAAYDAELQKNRPYFRIAPSNFRVLIPL